MHCKRTFTLYPDFALAHKRYEASFIFGCCASYVEDGGSRYGSVVLAQGMPIMYEDADSGMQLWPSSAWRWVSCLGALKETTCQALLVIKQKAPSTGLFRTLGTLRIGAHKYRSESRRQALKRCLSLLLISRIYARLFGGSLFPELATGSGFR